MAWITLPAVAYSGALDAHDAIAARTPRVARALKLTIGLPVAAYIGLCTGSLILFIMPNIYLTMTIADHLALGGRASVALLAINVLLGFVGLGLLEAADDPTRSI